MGFKTVDLDNENEKNEYKRHKRHEKFVRENRVERTETVTEPVKSPEAVEEKPQQVGPSDLCAKVIKIDQLRVRNYPEGDIIKLIPRDTELKILSEVDDCWYKVRLNDGTVGYCMKTYLRTFIDGEMYGLNDNRRCKTWPTTSP